MTIIAVLVSRTVGVGLGWPATGWRLVDAVVDFTAVLGGSLGGRLATTLDGNAALGRQPLAVRAFFQQDSGHVPSGVHRFARRLLVVVSDRHTRGKERGFKRHEPRVRSESESGVLGCDSQLSLAFDRLASD